MCIALRPSSWELRVRSTRNTRRLAAVLTLETRSGFTDRIAALESRPTRQEAASVHAGAIHFWAGPTPPAQIQVDGMVPEVRFRAPSRPLWVGRVQIMIAPLDAKVRWITRCSKLRGQSHLSRHLINEARKNCLRFHLECVGLTHPPKARGRFSACTHATGPPVPRSVTKTAGTE